MRQLVRRTTQLVQVNTRTTVTTYNARTLGPSKAGERKCPFNKWLCEVACTFVCIHAPYEFRTLESLVPATDLLISLADGGLHLL